MKALSGIKQAGMIRRSKKLRLIKIYVKNENVTLTHSILSCLMGALNVMQKWKVIPLILDNFYMQCKELMHCCH